MNSDSPELTLMIEDFRNFLIERGIPAEIVELMAQNVRDLADETWSVKFVRYFIVLWKQTVSSSWRPK
jgi:hypothetical protein